MVLTSDLVSDDRITNLERARCEKRTEQNWQSHGVRLQGAAFQNNSNVS